ncbi:Long-chain-fatty-acid--CoA ligase [Methylobacterium crusticola]|uniref:Long-chain-fatty-acid--CoA ligase n=1 Tax=Methylobacterium crusticola TaxID=1697972 RepID=A0ABQ4QZQ7_9HYPH|nr:acyl-CoA synthetase [Methylobacterium crusticola]GJD50345.1 Long-chain-fatty-acid--CoA ligase [Methylobacterium crusticola]
MGRHEVAREAVGARARRNTIADAFRRTARRHGARPALAFGDRAWSFAELDRAADRVAAGLAASGLAPGDRVGAYGRNSDAYVLLWLACTRAGLVHVPINYALTGRELRYIVEQSGARLLVHDPALAGTVAEACGALASATFAGGEGLDVLALATAAGAPAAEPADAPAGDEDLAQLLYTSGTTAAPKGAMMTHRGLIAEYLSCTVELGFGPHDRALAALPLYHSAQMHCFTMPQMLVGAATILIEAPAPEACLALIEQHRITSFFAPPTVWISLLRHPDFARRDLASLRHVYYGASIMPVPVLEELRRRLPGAQAFNCYGQSEIAPLATVLRPEEHDARPSSAGRPVLNVETRVVDAAMRDVAPGEQGEIVHRSPQLMVGYWDKPEETREAFEGGWFHSGDVGVMDAEGYLYVVDRMKDVIKTGGTMVASREVEEALFTHPAVSEVAVIALPDPKWIEAVTAVVVLRPGHEADAEGLIAHCRQGLAPFKVPKRILFRDDLPRNTAGKLLKRALRAEYAEDREATHAA